MQIFMLKVPEPLPRRMPFPFRCFMESIKAFLVPFRAFELILDGRPTTGAVNTATAARSRKRGLKLGEPLLICQREKEGGEDGSVSGQQLRMFHEERPSVVLPVHGPIILLRWKWN